MNLRDWEDLCRRCGECCFEKWIEADGTIIPTGVPCRYLDIVTRECKVYHKRFDVDEGCMLLTPEVVGHLRWLPQSCGYVRHLSGAHGECDKAAPESRGRKRRRSTL